MATNEQLYDRAIILIEGDSNIKANPKKGWKQIKELADSGYDKACIKYAGHLMDDVDDCFGAREYYEKVKLAGSELVNQYAVCLFFCAGKKKKDLEYIKGCCNALAKYENDLHGDGYYCYAILLKVTNPSQTEKINECLYYAALGGSEIMSDKEYAEIGRERGVLSTKKEMEAWLKVAEDAKYAKFIPCEKSEEDAWFYASENLQTKETKKILSRIEIQNLLESKPKGILEYQPLVRIAYGSGVCNFRFKYDNPKYTSVSSGSGKINVDTHWTACCATFKTKQKQNKLWQQYAHAKTTSNFVDARVRTSPYGYSEVVQLCSKMSSDDAKKGTRNDAKESVAKQYNYDKQYVKINIDSWDIHLYSLELVFVPFYFFTYKFSEKKSVTVRVNAFTCEVDYFENNPFGQFDETDDVTKGGGAGETAKTRSRNMGKSSGTKKASKKTSKFTWILLGIELLLTIIGFAADVVAMGVIFLLLFVLTAGLTIRKKFK